MLVLHFVLRKITKWHLTNHRSTYWQLFHFLSKVDRVRGRGGEQQQSRDNDNSNSSNNNSRNHELGDKESIQSFSSKQDQYGKTLLMIYVVFLSFLGHPAHKFCSSLMVNLTIIYFYFRKILASFYQFWSHWRYF